MDEGLLQDDIDELGATGGLFFAPARLGSSSSGDEGGGIGDVDSARPGHFQTSGVVDCNTSEPGVASRSESGNISSPTRTAVTNSVVHLYNRTNSVKWWAKSSSAEAQAYESLDYDTIFHPGFDMDDTKPAQRRPWGFTGATMVRWAFTTILAVILGCAARTIEITVDAIVSFRSTHLQDILNSGDPHHPKLLPAWWFLIGMNLVMCLTAGAAVVWVEPSAAGSGIAEVKAYLNGTHIPDAFRFRTIVCKFIGIILAVSSGLVVGPEGPMVHTGAGIASGLTRGDKVFRLSCREKATSFFKLRSRLLSKFHNDRDRRDFICAGAAAGLAAAFGAPIGGVLFALEEAASFWSPRLMWRCFVCTIMTTFTLAALKSPYFGSLSTAGLLSFGNRAGSDKTAAVFGQISFWEILPFAIIGVAGGLLGAMWNAMFKAAASIRPKKALPRLLEVACVSFFTSTVIIFLPYFFHACEPQTEPTPGFQFYCGPGMQNGMASIFFGMRESSILRLFTSEDHLSNVNLAVAGTTFYILMFLRCALVLGRIVSLFENDNGVHKSRTQAYMHRAHMNIPHVFNTHPHKRTHRPPTLSSGIAVPAGLFMPTIMTGACFGRIGGQFVQSFSPDVFPGAYALIGATALLGGIQRSSISLCVIIIEGTSNIHFLLPIVITSIIAKYVGNIFNDSLYDITIHLKRIPFLEPEPSHMLTRRTAKSCMTHVPVCFYCIEKVGRIVEVLCATSHGGFIVVCQRDGRTTSPIHERAGSASSAAAEGMHFQGIILRWQLRLILSLARKHDQPTLELGAHKRPLFPETLGVWEGMKQRHRSKAQPAEELVAPEDMDKWVDLTPYMNPATITVMESCPLMRVYMLFRTLGLRHLPVVSWTNQVVGLVTRVDLINHWRDNGTDDDLSVTPNGSVVNPFPALDQGIQ